MPLSLGAKVRQLVAPIEGTIAERQWNDTVGQFQYLIADADGNPLMWLSEDQVELVQGDGA